MHWGCQNQGQNQDNNALCLHCLNDVRKLVEREGTLDVHKQILLAISSQRIPRIDHVLCVGFRHGAGIHSMLELIKRAAQGTYHLKGFDEEDDLQALLFLRLSGTRVADIAHRIFGTPLVSTIWTHTTVPQIIASPSFPTRYEIEHNIATSFKGLLDILGVPVQKMMHAVIMFDELLTEKRPRWDDKLNKILGVCHEHGRGTSLELMSKEDLETLWEELVCEKIHLAHEVHVNLQLYSAHPILISGSCKCETAKDHTVLIQAVVDATNHKKDIALARLIYVAPLAPSSPIYDHLVHLELFDLFVGPDDITADKDYKHVFKRLYNTILHKKGCIVHGVKLTCALIRKHLQDCGLSNAHIDHILDPSNKQDVVLAYNLLKDLWCLPPADSELSSQPYIKVREALHLYGQLGYHLIYPYICVKLSLSKQLEHLSTAVHLVLALFVHSDAKSLFIPSTLFVDIGIMVKNVFFCVAKVKIDHPMQPFFIVLLGTDRLESLFGILHTMVGNDANLDILQLALRVTATTEVSNILAKHLEWDQSPHRLRFHTVSKNHTGPRVYMDLERLYLSSLTLATPWKCGRHLLEDKYP
ncbi:hypothetical protein BJV77DRAFT_1060936 [Russula vinacea]|nr:hypothetical protein BJV77DRAFT_1060936 [Russula vinacea]